MRALWVTALLVAVTLAGCADGSKTKDGGDGEFDDIETKATATTGVIRGVVFDPTIVPIAGATVTVKSADKETTTSEGGAFFFQGLEPGPYFLDVAKAGYDRVQTSVNVEAGIDKPPIVKIQLQANPSLAPIAIPYVFDGFIECSTGVGLPTGGYAYLSACSSFPQLFPGDHFAVTFDVGTQHPEWVQAEMVWESTQTISNHLSHNFYYPDPDELDGNMDQSRSGPSPLTNIMENATAKEYLEGLDHEAGEDLQLRMRVFTRATDGAGLALTLKQDFTIYTHLFYNWVPEEDWRFVEHGTPVPPA